MGTKNGGGGSAFPCDWKLHIWDAQINYRCKEMYNLLTSGDVLLELNVD